MATATTTTKLDASTDADWRAWGSWISARFTAAGWTAVYSNFATGTNWTDVTHPTVANTTRVTEIWAPADTAQGTTPYYVKLECGCGSTTTNPAIRISIGTGHNGSGTLTGILYDTGSTFQFSTSNTNLMTHYASYDTGRMQIMIGVSGTSWVNNNMWVLNIERRVDGSGNALTTGLHVHSWGSGNGKHQGLLAGAAHPTQVTGGIKTAAFLQSAASDQTFDSKIQISPCLSLFGPMEMGLGFVAAPQSVYSTGGTFTCTILGTTHTYIASQGTTQITGISGTHILCMRYE